MPAASRLRQTGELTVFYLLVRDFQDFRMARQQELVEDMARQVAEAAAEGDMLLGTQILLAKDQDHMVQMRSVDGLEGFIVKRLRQVQADNLRAESIG